MSKRIEELIWKSGVGDVVPEEMYKYLKEFAELVIKECVDLLPEDCQSKDGCHVYWTILNHFGIEE